MPFLAKSKHWVIEPMLVSHGVHARNKFLYFADRRSVVCYWIIIKRITGSLFKVEVKFGS